MRRKVSICFIGCGQFCRCFVPLFKKHPDVDYVAVCDLIPEKAKEYQKLFDVPIVPTFEDAISDPKFNAVAIFVQRHLHGPLVNRRWRKHKLLRAHNGQLGEDPRGHGL